MKRLNLSLVTVLAVGAVCSNVFATPIPLSALGLNKPVHVYTTAAQPGYPVTVSGVGTGGGFDGSVDGHSTTLWCVDSQLSVAGNADNFYNANVIRLTDIPANAQYVRYGNVSGLVGQPGNNWLVDLDSGFNGGAQIRYQMAAYLVSQYVAFPDGPVPNDSSAAGLKNKAIQRAIWRTMVNDTFGHDPDVLTGDIDDGVVGYSNWIEAAKAFVTSPSDPLFFTKWAVVSGGVNSDGSFNSSKKQTYLVELPEPRFYGLLAIGLIGIFLCAQRRKACLLSK